MHRILAEKSVNITELRKNPAKYFIDQPVAVLFFFQAEDGIRDNIM